MYGVFQIDQPESWGAFLLHLPVDEGNALALNCLLQPFLGAEETDVCPGSLRAVT